MNKTEKELCSCLGCVLLGSPKRPVISDFSTLLRAARHHSVSVMLADLPSECLQGMERDQQMQLIADVLILEKRHVAMNKTIAGMARDMKREGCDYYLLKGQNCAARYPHPERRQIGDIDLYVAPQHFKRAAKFFQNQGYHVIESTMQHLTMSNGRDIELELHYVLQCLQWPRHDRALRRMCGEASNKESITLDDTAVNVLPQELDIVMLCVHTMNHLYCAGLGLRHVCDYLMRVRWALDRNLDKERLEQMLREVGAYHVYCVLNYICNQYLHANLPLPTDKRNGKNVLRWMMKSGNFSNDIDLGTGAKRFVRYYSQFLWHCITFFPVSPLESIAWPIMKLKRAIMNESHKKIEKNTHTTNK